MYKCLECGKEIEEKQIRDKVRCPFCGFRIITKETPKTVKKVTSE